MFLVSHLFNLACQAPRRPCSLGCAGAWQTRCQWLPASNAVPVPDRYACAATTLPQVGQTLGGTNVTANGTNGAELGRVLYRPWGETRLSSGSTPTTWRFTGQREDATIGLYFYNARYLDPQLGRFVQPDTIVPEPGNPQGLNRYSYVLNNPLRFIDPSGYDPLDTAWQQEFRATHGRNPTAEDILIRLFSIAFPGQWNWNRFYDEQGNYIAGSLESVFRDNRPADWTWSDVPVALERMTGWYNPGEEGLYTRDIGSLFGGLPNRLETPHTWEAVSHPGNPIRVWVYVSRAGLPARLMGTSDLDANIHHWAWGLAMGGAFGPGASFINVGREITQFQGNWGNSWSDVEIGNRGAALAVSFRVSGTGRVRSAWNRIMLDRWFSWE